MRRWSAERIAAAAQARLLAGNADHGPELVTIDSRQAGPGVLFVGLRGSRADGGAFAADALAKGAWGVLVGEEWGDDLALAAERTGAVLAAGEPLAALQRLARAWRRELGAQVIGVTGSTGKTSTKDLLLALLSPHRRTVASRANFNTEIGLPLEILRAPEGTEVLVLEMAMRGPGQIAELAQVAEPDVGVIVNVGPVHLELLGTVENVAAAKAELIAGLAPGATAVVPHDEPLLAPHLRSDVRTIRFGPGGEVRIVEEDEARVVLQTPAGRVELEVDFQAAHLRANLAPAVAAAEAVDVTPAGRVGLSLTAGRGAAVTVPGGVTVLDGCYNANPMSMRAALADLAATARRSRPARTVAVLGDMLELGPQAHDYHVRLGSTAAEAGVDVLITVGPLAAAIAEGFPGEAHRTADAEEAARLTRETVREGDLVLVKGSLGVGLRRVCEALGVPAAGEGGMARNGAPA